MPFDIAVDGVLVDVEEAEKLGEQFVPVDNGAARCVATLVGEDRSAVLLVLDEPLGIEALEHVGHAGLRDPETARNVDRAGVALLLDEMQDLLEVVVHRDRAAGP